MISVGVQVGLVDETFSQYWRIRIVLNFGILTTIFPAFLIWSFELDRFPGTCIISPKNAVPDVFLFFLFLFLEPSTRS